MMDETRRCEPPRDSVGSRAKGGLGTTGAWSISSGASGRADRIVLRTADHQQDEEITTFMKIIPRKVARWRRRFLAFGVVGR